MVIKKNTKGSKLTRTQTVTVRFDPKLRYLAEIAARKQRRTVSSFIEWAVEESLNNVFIYQGSGYNKDEDISIAEEANRLYDVDEAERFARLAIFYPDLLTHDEQLLWKIICDTGLITLGKVNEYPAPDQWDLNVLEQKVFPSIRKHWKTFLAIANGSKDISEAPDWRGDV